MSKTILTPEAIREIEAFESENAGYYYRMLDFILAYIEAGAADGSFTREEAEHDLETALRISYACNNIGDYEHYYMARLWLEGVEDLAGTSGVWHYRYACALIYCGRPEQALSYAERGVQADPAYPWGWLLLARLRSHFGDRDGALAANDAGLALMPGDYEFLRQEADLRAGRGLEQLMDHYIYAGHDRQLQAGQPEPDENREALSGIVCRREELAAIKAVIAPTRWEPDAPYCTFDFPFDGGTLEGRFEMNEAALSKFDLDWIRDTFAGLPGRSAQHTERLKRTRQIPSDAVLSQVIIRRDRSVRFTYQYDGPRPNLNRYPTPICP